MAQDSLPHRRTSLVLGNFRGRQLAELIRSRGDAIVTMEDLYKVASAAGWRRRPQHFLAGDGSSPAPAVVEAPCDLFRGEDLDPPAASSIAKGLSLSRRRPVGRRFGWFSAMKVI